MRTVGSAGELFLSALSLDESTSAAGFFTDFTAITGVATSFFRVSTWFAVNVSTAFVIVGVGVTIVFDAG